MPTTSISKIKTHQKNLYLRVAKGHFATSSAHSNYYIDVAAQKSRLSEAKAVAQEICKNHKYSNQIIDTILCLDGTEVIATCIAEELTKSDYVNINAHQTIYIVTPEEIEMTEKWIFDNYKDSVDKFPENELFTEEDMYLFFKNSLDFVLKNMDLK